MRFQNVDLYQYFFLHTEILSLAEVLQAESVIMEDFCFFLVRLFFMPRLLGHGRIS